MATQARAYTKEVLFMGIANDVRNELINTCPVDTGGLKLSIDVVDNVTSGKPKLIITMNRYGEYVEFGRPPGKMPPVDELKKWCKRKLGDESLAFAVAQHIKKNGTRPHPFIRPMINNKLPDIIKKWLG